MDNTMTSAGLRRLLSVAFVFFLAVALGACDQAPTGSGPETAPQADSETAQGNTETAQADSSANLSSTDRHIVGLTAGQMKVGVDAASDVHQTFDFGEIGVAVSGRFPDQALEALKNNPNVRYIEKNGVMEAHDHTVDEGNGDPNQEQVLPWGIDRVDAEVAQHNGETANGAKITIIDTGIDSDHETLVDNIAGGKAWVDCRGGGCNTSWDDDNDHGTHVAGTADAVSNNVGVVGVGIEADLYAAKVLDKRGSGSFDDVAAAIEWSADQEHDVANMSLGGGKSNVVEDAVEYAYGKGVLLVASAGNDGSCTDCVNYPAAEPEVMAVSATDDTDALASFSSTGQEVELAAPGVDVLSSIPGDNYDQFSGTSMSAPHVTGGGAQLMANGSSNTEARDQLKNTAEDIGLGDNEQGAGLLDVAASLGLDSSNDLGSSDNSAPTVGGASLSEVEADDSDAEFDASWDVSDTDGNLAQVELVLTDTENSETEDTKTVDVSGSSASGTDRLVATGDEGSGHTYEVTVTVTDTERSSDSETASATESGDTSGGNAPAIDTFELTDNSNPRWARVAADWTVSDEDGDLAEVTTEVTFANGATDSQTSSVSGSSASGTDEFRERDGHGDAEVTLTVTDTEGNQTSDTKTISLN